MTAGDARTRRLLEGPLSREALYLGAPLALAMFLQVLFNLVDQYLIARLPDAIANPSLDALGIADMVGALATIASYGISSATATLIAQANGRGDHEELGRVAWGGLAAVVGFGVLVGLGAIVGADAIVHTLLGARGTVRALGRDYLRVNLGGVVTVFVMFQVTSVQRALGHARAQLVVFGVGNVLNLVLAVLLVYGPGPAPAIFAWGPPLARALSLPRLEIVGAAWATVLARAVAAALGVALLARWHPPAGLRALLPRASILRAVLALAWPTSTQFALRIGAVLVVIALVHRHYTTALDNDVGTAYALTLRLETLATFVAMGWGGAAQTLVGTAIGARRPERAARAGWITTAYATATMVVLVVLFRVAGEGFLRFFSPRDAVVGIALGYLATVAPSYLAVVPTVVMANAIIGAGTARLALLVDLVLLIALQVPLMVLATGPLGLAPQGLWATVAGMNLVGGMAYLLVWRRRELWSRG